MKAARLALRAADKLLNWLTVLCFLPILLYALYGLWDSQHVYQAGDASLFAEYKPTEDNSVSFDELRKLNPEVFGWLTVYGTKIDYPVTQADDNDKYINTNARGEFYLGGSIFLDYRNKQDFSDLNNIIYGHHLEEQKMFGGLDNFEEESYFEEHRYGKLYYDGKWHGLEFFAFVFADAYDQTIYNVDLEDDDSEEYLSYIEEEAMYFRQLEFDEADRFVELSTCVSDETNGRFVLIGRITDAVEPDPFEGETDGGTESTVEYRFSELATEQEE